MNDFPWYGRMHALMGTSPVATRAAVAHSTTEIDTSILDRNTVCYLFSLILHSKTYVHTQAGQRARSLSWDPNLGLSRPPSASRSPASHAGSPALDNEDGDDDRSSSEAPPAPTPIPSASKKRKSLADSASEIAEHERTNRRKISENLAKEKTTRSVARERVKRAAHMDVEVARMEHDKNEANARRAHEIVLMDRQMAMEQFRAGNTVPRPSNADQNQMLDPGLWPNR